MTYATNAQISFLNSLIAQSDYTSVTAASDAYGIGFRNALSLSISEASQLIDWLKTPTRAYSQAEIEDLKAAVALADADKAARAAVEKAVQAERDAKVARVDVVMIERGLDHLTGKARRDARYLINKEIA